MCVFVVLENLVMPEKKWLKIVPEHSGLGLQCWRRCRKRRRDGEERSGGVPLRGAQERKGDLYKEPKANFRCSQKLKCAGRVGNHTSAVSFDKFWLNR